MFYKILFICTAIISCGEAADNRPIPDTLRFGCATASYQVEGAWNEDGKGENIWDHVAHTNPSFIKQNNSGDIACDSYHKYKEDVAMLKDLGVHFYRFSISWTRVLPYGLAGSPINQKGIDYYRNLTQELIDNGIEPMVTIFHWDTPQVLEEIGGWPNPELADHYVYYARLVFENLGDLVKLWFTFNEPKQICLQGYGTGEKAPGYNASGYADYECAHTVLKAHAKAYHMYDEEFREKQGGRVGIVIDTPWFEPASGLPEDIEAAENAIQFNYGWYANPVVFGNYPKVMIDRIAARSEAQGFAQSRLPVFTEEEQDFLKGTADFLTINTYSTSYTASREPSDINVINFDTDLDIVAWLDPGWEESLSTWVRVVPWGLRKLVNWISKTYNNPEIFVTENGYGDDGRLDDADRLNYYKEYISGIVEAIYDDGVNVTRYTAWSLMDNFEWRSGFTEKLGLYQVNFTDPERTRTAKSSAAFYKKIISTRCLEDICINV